MAVSQSDSLGTDDFKTLLRDIFYSEELRIDSQFAANLKEKLDELCRGQVPEEQSSGVRFSAVIQQWNLMLKPRKMLLE